MEWRTTGWATLGWMIQSPSTMRRALNGDKAASGNPDPRCTLLGRPRVTTDPGTPIDELPRKLPFYVCIYLLDAFSAMYLVTEDADAYERPTCQAVAMDVKLRRFAEFQTVRPDEQK